MPTPKPTSVIVEEDGEVIEEIYIYNETTQYYPCECECNSSAYGVLNAGQTYEVGGYYGWEYMSAYPDMYPLADLHVSIGDTVLFKARDNTNSDLWYVFCALS